MTTESDEATDQGRDNLSPRNRGGAADVDRSKGFDTESDGSPFGSPKRDSTKPQDEATEEKTP